MRQILTAGVLALGLAGSLAGPALAQQPAPQTIPVGTVAAQLRPVTRSASFVGRVQAVNMVNIRARVTGFLEAVQFTEGDMVAEGAQLFRIEAGPFQAAVEQAQGEVLRAEGQLTNASLQRQRAEELVKTAATPVAVRDERVAQEQTAKGNMATAQAALDSARINLGYTQIVSPIAGRIGRAMVTKGNVVGPDSGTLTTIVSVDPMYVLFPVSQRDYLNAQRGATQGNTDSMLVRLRFPDGSPYDQTGRINFVDVMVNQATDTVMVRATVANPKGLLVDGQLLQVELASDKPVEKVVVPQAALIADQEGIYVFVVEDGKAVVRRVKLGGESGTDTVIEDGLKGGEQVIVEGLQSIRPGAAVRAAPVRPFGGG